MEQIPRNFIRTVTVAVLLGIACLPAALAGGRVTQNAADAGATERPNVIFISVDTLRADHLSCYGYNRPTSPRLDNLAARSVRFANAFSQASWTLPSHMSMVTSQYPHVHGVEDNGEALPLDATTLASVLSDNGYHTAAFVSWVYLGRKYGFDAGFDEFVELLPPKDRIDSATSAAFKAEQVTEEAIAWLDEGHSGPFFLFLHYFDPHINYEAPEPYGRMFDPDYEGPARGTFGWLERYIKGCHRNPNAIEPRALEHVTALYDGEIRYTDSQLGRLFDTIERTIGLDNCLIVFTSDHGEEFNEHGSMEGHQWTLYEEVIHVPLIMHFPGRTLRGRVVDRPVELIDIASTLLAWLDIPRPDTFQGENLLPWMAGRPAGSADPIAFGEIDRFNRKQYIRTERYKLIHTNDIGNNERGVPVIAGYELFDLECDPTEQVNLFAQLPEVAGPLMWTLEQHRRNQVGTDSANATRKVELSNHDLDRLRSLGYVGAGDE